MTKAGSRSFSLILPGAAFLIGMFMLTSWMRPEQRSDVTIRIPSGKGAAVQKDDRSGERNKGTLIQGKGKPAQDNGIWNQFRGPDRNGIASDKGLLREFPEQGPRIIWKKKLGEGHAGPAVYKGRVYVVDYDKDKREDVIRCFSLDNGEDIWSYSYYVKIKTNHGMSRTIPSVTEKYVVSIGPMCHVTCLDTQTGRLIWKKDLVKEYGSTVPPWYAGQCPFIEGDSVILGIGGKDVLVMGIDLETGSEKWRTPNPDKSQMTHSTIVGLTFAGIKQYVYCGSMGIVGVSASDGNVLWKNSSWRITPANVPTPLIIGKDRILFTAGYGKEGALMLRLTEEQGKISYKEEFRLKIKLFGNEQQTPLLYKDHVYGVISSGEMACIDLNGKQLWKSGRKNRYGIAPYCIADGMIYVLHDQKGTLHLLEASPEGFKEITRTRVLHGHDAWAPMALVSGKLILRDVHDMVCIDVKGGTQ
ncbi:PQQ-binding-like beta-propeller repeat protein [Planctomycetota bacterium]